MLKTLLSSALLLSSLVACDPFSSDRYIVVLRPSAETAATRAKALAEKYGAEVPSHIYESALQGFAIDLTAAQVSLLESDTAVAYLEEDREVSLAATQLNPPPTLDRIDQRDLPVDAQYEYDATGAGVSVYVIDTGLRATHTEFGGRAVGAFTTINDGCGTDDCHGHGTHVAGTIGAATYGVAKNVQIYGVRVLNASGGGTLADIIAGIDWVSANATLPAVANVSIQAGASQAIDDAVRRSINAGIVYVLAAGNSTTDACNVSPARTGEGITVAASDGNDQRASFSNYGACVDLFAPGVNVLSAHHVNDNATTILSGTSMAAPHVAGVVALYLEGNPTATPGAVAQALLSVATPGKITDAQGSPNVLLFSRTGPAAPVVVSECSELCPDLNNCYGVGVLNVQPQFCSNQAAHDTGLRISGAVLSSIPQPGSTQVYRCNQYTPSLVGAYAFGVLTTRPEFCSNADATDTGLRVVPGMSGAPGPQPGTTAVYRCQQLCPDLRQCVGVGILTTDPVHCANGLAVDTGLRVL
jgi:hypothetical protein